MKLTSKIHSLLIFCIIISISQRSNSQGVQVMSKSDYDKLPTPSILSGAGDLDRKYSIPDTEFPPPGDQGSNWSCTTWSIGYYLESYYQGKLTNTPPTITPKIFSHSYVYDILRRCRNNACNCGLDISMVLKYIQLYGNVPLALYSNCCTVPGNELKQEASKYKIKNWLATQTSNLNDLKSYVLDGIPVIVCIGIKDDFKNFRNKTEADIFNFQDTGNYDEYLAHCVLITGYDDDRRCFRILNSFGASWGCKGFGWVSYDSFRRMFVATGQQAFIIKRDVDPFFAELASASNTSNTLVGAASDKTFRMAPDTTIVNLTKMVKRDSLTKYPNPNNSESYISKYNKFIYSSSEKSTNGRLGSIQLDSLKFSDLILNNKRWLSKFQPYATKEGEKKGRYYFTAGFNINDTLISKVLNITYIYDDPTFVNKSYTSYKRPNFESSYTGWGCLEQMTAIIRMSDGSSFPITFSPCQLIERPEVLRSLEEQIVNITPEVTADLKGKDTYIFRVRLRGIDGIKHEISKVLYERDDPSFKQRFQTVTDATNNFESSYKGWGCLSHLIIKIHFKNGLEKTIDYNMCKTLGWN